MSAELEEEIEAVKAERDYWRSEAKLDAAAADIDLLMRKYSITPTQAWVLCVLFRAGDRVVRTERLSEDMPGLDWEDRSSSSNTQNVLVSRIRSKIGRDCIVTSWGQGYRLSDWMRREMSQVLS